MLRTTTSGASSGVAWAQESVPVINADGESGTSNAGLNPAVDADGLGDGCDENHAAPPSNPEPGD